MSLPVWKIKAAVGPSDEKVWSQTRVWESGRFLGAVLVRLQREERAELVELASLGILILTELSEKIEQADFLTIEKLKGIVEPAVLGVGDGIDVSIGVLIGEEDCVRAAVYGKVGLALWRGGECYRLLTGVKKCLGLKGNAVVGDRFLLADSETLTKVEKNKNEELLEAAVESLAHEEKGSEGMVGVVGGFLAREAKRGGGFWKERPIYIKTEDRKILYRRIGLVVLLCLGVLILVGSVRRQKQKTQEAYERILSEVATTEAVAREIVEDNPDKVVEMMASLNKKALEYREQAPKSETKRADEVLRNIDLLTKDLLKRKEVELRTFVEFALFGIEQQKKMRVTKQDILQTFNKDRIVWMSIKDKSQGQIELVGGEGMIDYVFVDERLYVLKKDGIWAGAIKNNRVELKMAVEADEAWQDPFAMESFGGSLYVLDHGTGEISKYVIAKENILPRKRWFGRGVVLDLSKIVDFVVDGDVWLLSSSGKLEKFARGVPAEFAIKGGVDNAGNNRLQGVAALASSEQEVYLLDSWQGRVMVFDRSGKYLRQYVSSEMKGGVDLLVVGGSGYILFDGLIKSFGL